MKKKISVKDEARNSDQSENEKSEEFVRFEQGLIKIFSLTPEQARAIRESPIPPDPDAGKENS